MDKEPRKERKIYKGEVKTVEQLEKEGVSGVPVQPVKTKFTLGNNTGAQSLPPSFVLTKFTAGWVAGARMLHYYNLAKGFHAQAQVPGDLELNVLSGLKGAEMSSAWADLVKTQLSRVVKRATTTMGADPEIFVVDKGGKVVPAWAFLGSKQSPTSYGDKLQGTFVGDLYWDGFQAEFTTPPNLTCLMQMGDAVRTALVKLQNTLPKGAKLSAASVVDIDSEVLATAKAEHVAFGCMPSKNIYGLSGNTRDGRDVPYRFAGGHIHFGLNDAQKAKIPEMVRALDTVLGVACVSLFAGLDSPIRRQFYGQAGEYRTPPHGLEYRVLSNAWLIHPAIYHMVFDLSRVLVGLVDDGLKLGDVWTATEAQTIDVIMNADVDKARGILKDNDPVFRELIKAGGGAYLGNPLNLAVETWTKGAGHLVKEPENIHRNWRLGSDTDWHHYNTARTFGQAAVKGPGV